MKILTIWNLASSSVRKCQYKIFAISIFIGLILSLLPVRIRASSTFFIRNGSHLVCGRNIDYYYSNYMITVNKRNFTKTALQYAGELVGTPAIWTSKYGSITFNMFGREVPADGMNEAGLVISALILEQSEYSVIPNKPSISIDQWIQYLLDNFATVEEVIEGCSQINIRYNPQDLWRVHIFVTDSNGTNAVIEFLNGELVAHTKETLEKKAITNSTYESSIAYYENGVITGNPLSSLNRYYKIAEMLDNYNNENLIDYAYDIMDSVAQRITIRSIVYDISNRRVYLLSSGNDNIRYFDLSFFDFSCEGSVMIYQESLTDTGDISGEFIQYTSQINRDFIELGWQFMGKSYTENELTDFSQYPESFNCIATSINQILKTEKLLEGYPNPANQFLNVKLPLYENKQIRITILNISGKVVYDKIKNNIHQNDILKINTSSLQNGLYIVNIKTGNSIYRQKFIKVSDSE